MIQIRPARERGHFNHGWLGTAHTFSFADYYDPAHISFRALRVMNEDRIAPQAGFGMHGHRDMEIVTYVLSGQLAHKDSLGNVAILRAGELQRMTAGTGIRHSEHNPSETEPIHLYQIWLLPHEPGLSPSYEQRSFPANDASGPVRLVVSPDGQSGSLIIQQDARIYLATLAAGETVTHTLQDGRFGWLQVLRGQVRAADHQLTAGDGAAVSDTSQLAVTANEPTELMWFDLA